MPKKDWENLFVILDIPNDIKDKLYLYYKNELKDLNYLDE